MMWHGTFLRWTHIQAYLDRVWAVTKQQQCVMDVEILEGFFQCRYRFLKAGTLQKIHSVRANYWELERWKQKRFKSLLVNSPFFFFLCYFFSFLALIFMAIALSKIEYIYPVGWDEFSFLAQNCFGCKLSNGKSFSWMGSIKQSCAEDYETVL